MAVRPSRIWLFGAVGGDGTKVTIDIQEMQSNNSVTGGQLQRLSRTRVIGPADPQSQGRSQPCGDLRGGGQQAHLAERQTARRVSRFRWPWPVRSRIGPSTNIIGPIVAELLSGTGYTRVPATVTMVDRLLGWNIEVNRISDTDPVGPYRVDLARSLSTVAFGVVLLGVLIALASFGLFVAVQTARDKRKFQPPMTTWYAAMLFAVVPLRNALPDSPPFGGWIDITIVLWVIVVLVISMGLYISCWWRHLKPEPGIRGLTRVAESDGATSSMRRLTP